MQYKFDEQENEKFDLTKSTNESYRRWGFLADPNFERIYKENIEPMAHEENLYDATKETPKNKLKEESWWEEIDMAIDLLRGGDASSDEVKHCIKESVRQLLEKEKERWVEIIKETRTKHRNECDYDYCDAEDLLTDLIKKF